MNNSNGFRMTEIGLLPEDWEVKKLNQLFEIQQGKALSPKHRRGISPYPFLRTSNVYWGRIDLTNLDYMDFSTEEVDKMALRTDDLLICEGGDIGRTAMWSGQIKKCCYQNHLHRLRPLRKNEAFPKFFMYWMQASMLLLGLYVGAGNKTTIPNLSRARLGEFQLPLPFFSEQQKIASVLSAVQEAKEKTENVIKALKEFKKSMMKHLFTYGPVPYPPSSPLNKGGIEGGVPLKETEIGMIPEHWEVSMLGKYCKVLTGGTPKTKVKEYWLPAEIPWMKSGEIQGSVITKIDTYISKKGLENSNARLLPKNTVVIALAGRGKTRGTTAILKTECACNQSVACMISNEQLHYYYLHYYLSFIYVYIRNLTGDKDRSGLNLQIIQRIPLILPPLTEQHQIAESLSAIDKKIEAENTKKNSLEALFKTLLSLLMTGKIRVKDLDI
ncbi:MAG: restriction endonuclease subunit S [Nitrospirae bacterium]|nr:restriction endonuclease subunit S [Nitrospirota bacterium]